MPKFNRRTTRLQEIKFMQIENGTSATTTITTGTSSEAPILRVIHGNEEEVRKLLAVPGVNVNERLEKVI